jgi:polyribonucleotide nucleotidyltransferase
MAEIFKVEKKIGESNLILETGRIGKQADATVVATYGETMVLAAVVSAPPRSADIDYFPLSVEYRERLSAAGKFPGGFMKREGRPTTKEILTSRLIDRPIRPLFPDGYFDEVQITVNVISADTDNDPDVLAMVAASAALSISSIPFQGPIGAVRLSRIDGQFVINPTYPQREKSDFNLMLAGRRDALNMIEVDAKQLPESVIAEGIATAHKSIIEICDLIDEFTAKCGKQKQVPEINWDQALADEIKAKYSAQIKDAFTIISKKQRNETLKAIVDGIKELCCKEQDGK